MARSPPRPRRRSNPGPRPAKSTSGSPTVSAEASRRNASGSRPEEQAPQREGVVGFVSHQEQEHHHQDRRYHDGI